MLKAIVVVRKKQLIKFLCHMNASIINDRPHGSDDVSKAGYLESASDVDNFVCKESVWIIRSLAGGQKSKMSFETTTHYFFGSQVGYIPKPLSVVSSFKQYQAASEGCLDISVSMAGAVK